MDYCKGCGSMRLRPFRMVDPAYKWPIHPWADEVPDQMATIPVITLYDCLGCGARFPADEAGKNDYR